MSEISLCKKVSERSLFARLWFVYIYKPHSVLMVIRCVLDSNLGCIYNRFPICRHEFGRYKLQTDIQYTKVDINLPERQRMDLYQIRERCSIRGDLASILHCDEFAEMFPRTMKLKCLSDVRLFLGH